MEIFTNNINLLFVTKLDLLIVGVTVAATGVFGFTLYLSNKKSITNITFLLFTLITMLWGAVNYLSYQVESPEIILWFLRFIMFFAVWQAFLIFQLCLVVPNENYQFSKYYKILLLPIVLATSVITLTPLIWSKIVEQSNIGFVSNPDRGPGLFIFGFVAVGLVLSGFWILIKRIRKSNEVQKTQLKLVLWGSLITFTLIIIFNFLVPVITGNRTFVPYGSVFMFPMVAFISYAIYKHKLFNIRVAGTALLVFALSIVSFIEVTQATDWVFIVYRSSVLFFILVFGIVLIRSVLKEVKLREQVETLAKEIQRAYEVEKKANAELANLDKTKNQFLLLIQHNLRTPLTSMRGYSDLLLNGTYGKTSKKVTEVVKKFQQSTENLIKMVNDFLDVSQFQLGKNVIRLQHGVEVVPLIEDIIGQLKEEADARGIYLKLERPEQPFAIDADKEKIKAAIYNIIHNSIKYTIKGGVSVTLHNHDTVKIIIKDTGIGISAENLKTLFNRIFQRDEQAKKTDATGKGIGLYLASQIIKNHGGKIWAESEGEGKGTTFFIELPLHGNVDTKAEKSDGSELIKNI